MTASLSNEPFMVTFTVYKKPLDYPNSFVVRRWACFNGKPDPVPDARFLIVSPTLEMARASLLEINPGLSCLARADADDPVIVETWL